MEEKTSQGSLLQEVAKDYQKKVLKALEKSALSRYNLLEKLPKITQQANL